MQKQEQPTYLTPYPRKKTFSLFEWLADILQSTINMAVEAQMFFAMMVGSAFVGAIVWFLLFIFRVGFYFPLIVGVAVAIAVFRLLLNINTSDRISILFLRNYKGHDKQGWI